MKIRAALSVLAVVVAMYFAVRGAIAPHETASIGIRVVSTAMFLVAVLVALVAPSKPEPPPHVGPGRVHLWAAILASVIAAVLPIAATWGMPRSDRLAEPDTTWFIGAAGVVLTIVCARRRNVCAWAGAVAFSLSTMHVFGSVSLAFTAGILGSLVWIGIAQIIVLYTDRAHRDTVRLALIQQESAAWRATQQVRRRERRERVQLAISVAGPVLSRAIEARGHLTDPERAEAIIAEATLRDELRGAQLLNAEVRTALAELRRAGSTITLFDEGGLDDLDDEALTRVRGELAHVLRGTTAPSIIVRTSHLADTAVTIAGRGADGDALLWYEVPRR